MPTLGGLAARPPPKPRAAQHLQPPRLPSPKGGQCQLPPWHMTEGQMSLGRRRLQERLEEGRQSRSRRQLWLLQSPRKQFRERRLRLCSMMEDRQHLMEGRQHPSGRRCRLLPRPRV